MPQFDFANVFVPQVFWLAVFFVILYFGVVRLTLPRLDKVMGEREDRIAGDLDAAKAAKDSADSISATYAAEMATARENARQAIADAKAKAAKDNEKKLAAAAAKADAQLAEAEERIAAALNEAQATLRDAAAEGAQAIVSKLTGSKVGLGDARKAVQAQLKA